MSGNHKGKPEGLLNIANRTDHIQVFLVICTDAEVAKRIAFQIHKLKIPNLYTTSMDCIDAWKAYPQPSQKRYKPFAVCINRNSEEVLFVDSLLEYIPEYANATR